MHSFSGTLIWLPLAYSSPSLCIAAVDNIGGSHLIVSFRVRVFHVYLTEMLVLGMTDFSKSPQWTQCFVGVFRGGGGGGCFVFSISK